MINPLTVIGILRTVKGYTPPKPPAGYGTDEGRAYLTGWRECAEMFEESAIRMVEREDER